MERSLSSRVVITSTLLLILLSPGCYCEDIGLTVPETVNGIVGEPVTLPASYENGHKLISVTWSKVRGGLSGERTAVFAFYPPQKYSYGPLEGRASLVGIASLKINKADSSDEGLYVVTVFLGAAGTQERHVYLNILVRPIVTVGPRSPYIVTSGKDYILNCSITKSKPEVNDVYWTKDGVRLTTSRRQAKYEGGDSSYPSLVIRDVGRGDSGEYACVADHVTGSVSKSMTLGVLYAADIIKISESMTAANGDDVQLYCVADGNPPPDVYWTFQGAPVRTEVRRLNETVSMSKLLLDGVSGNDTGLYACSVRNGVGSRAVTRWLKLRVRLPGEPEGGYTQITIIAGACAGSVWLLLCIFLLAIYIRRRRKRSRVRESKNKDFAYYYTDDPYEFQYLGLRSFESGSKRSTSGVKAAQSYETGLDGGRRYAKALYNYSPLDEDELRLCIGDIIEVIKGEGDGWWFGYLNGRVGMFPSNYVEVLSSDDRRTNTLPLSRKATMLNEKSQAHHARAAKSSLDEETAKRLSGNAPLPPPPPDMRTPIKYEQSSI
ncbi:nectin-4-like isoform X1 [Branchiostoma floridae x Branchiostoma belcheri]